MLLSQYRYSRTQAGDSLVVRQMMSLDLSLSTIISELPLCYTASQHNSHMYSKSILLITKEEQFTQNVVLRDKENY